MIVHNIIELSKSVTGSIAKQKIIYTSKMEVQNLRSLITHCEVGQTNLQCIQ